MENHDIETEFPEGLKEMLRRLRGQLAPGESCVTENPDMRQDFYGFGYGNRAAKQARKRILDAIGNCSSMEIFREEYLIYCGLDSEEWEMVLSPLRNNFSLKKVSLISDCDSDSFYRPRIEAEERRGKLWEQLLRTSQTLKAVEIRFNATQATSFLPELASGLRDNPGNSLEVIEFYSIVHEKEHEVIVEEEKERVITHAAELIKYATNLQILKFRGSVWWSRENPIGQLTSSVSNAMRQHLNELEITDVSPRDVNRWWQACSNVIKESVPALTSVNISVSTVDIGCRRTAEPESFRLETKMCSSSPSHSLKIDLRFRSASLGPRNLVTAITKFLDACPPASLQGYVYYHVDKFHEEMRKNKDESYEVLNWALTHDVVKELCVIVPERKDSRLQQLFQRMQTNSSVLKLSLRNVPSSYRSFWKSLFDALKDNTSLRCLDLAGCHLKDENFNPIMSLLQDNTTLEKVELRHPSWENDGKVALIEEAIARNRNKSSYFSAMQAANFKFGLANLGRIFLCGSPYAGKTCLKMSMMRTCKKRSNSESVPEGRRDKVGNLLRILKLWRTQGVEVELLRDDEWGQVYIWDLAGQYIFRALQDLIFPRTNTSCIFVFVFNPFQENSDTLKENVYGTFRSEMEEWLKFIVSNSQITGSPPRVLAVITNKDRSETILRLRRSNYPRLDLGHFKGELVQLQERFAGRAELFLDLHHLNAQSKREVRPLTEYIFQSMGSFFSKNPLVPIVCSELSSALIRNSRSRNPSPVWTQSAFLEFCKDSRTALRDVSPEVLQAVVSYLHDVGSIIKVARDGIMGVKDNTGDESKDKEPWIVVDPNWLTQNFLGELICQGHRFRFQDGRIDGNWSNNEVSSGLAQEANFHRLLEEVLRSKHNSWRKIGVSSLEDIMQDLDLCYRVTVEDGSVRYFVPIVYGGLGERLDVRERLLILRWDTKDAHQEECQYLGYRLHCKDAIMTTLTAAFFPRFEIHYRNKLIKKLGMSENCINCYLGVMMIRDNGYEIFVESDEVTGQFVDILVKSSQVEVEIPRRRQDVMKFVKRHVLQEIQAFCASQHGCPGIELEVSIIRSTSVQELIPIPERGEKHCVKLEGLKQKLQLLIERDLLSEDKKDVVSISTLHHSWPAELGGAEKIRDLLGEGDVIDVLNKIRSSIRETEIHMNLNGLVPTWLDDGSNAQVDGEGSQETSSSSSHMNPSPSEAELTKGEKFLADKIDRAVEDLKFHVDKKFSEMSDQIVREFRLKSQKIESAISSINLKIDKMIGYSISREDHASPRRPYFTLEDADMIDRITSFILHGKAVRLHFMCEARNGPHIVTGQQGLSLMVTSENMSWVTEISKISLKLIDWMLHAGIQITTGFAGSLLPNFSDLDTGKCLPMSSELFEYLKLKPGTSTEDHKMALAWSSLQCYLDSKLGQGGYGRDFLLYRVFFFSGTDTWVKPLYIVGLCNVAY
ncbi:hypothetical protein R1flu_017107 [Riccia fluitans]|uniref:C-terminal of Roc (COR) domain-containing protein n=1 Tax=Riccia fluitans TaxID=41844 RepID=A0ABD1YP94_9MARC